VRFFGGFDFSDADAAGDLPAVGYGKGVPMGGDLKAAPAGKAPMFLIAAMKDPEVPNLDRVQVIKGWVDAAGRHTRRSMTCSGPTIARRRTASFRQSAYGGSDDGEVHQQHRGSRAARRVKDPEFDAAQRGFYYARVIEIPTPRWSCMTPCATASKWTRRCPWSFRNAP